MSGVHISAEDGECFIAALEAADCEGFTAYDSLAAAAALGAKGAVVEVSDAEYLRLVLIADTTLMRTAGASMTHLNIAIGAARQSQVEGA
jgi:hypothetical protein